MDRFRAAAGAVAVAMAASAMAAPAAAPVAGLMRAFLTSGPGLGWEDLDSRTAVQWLTPGPTMLKTNAPDGGSFARPGTATIDGRTFSVAATGARAGVGSIYFSEATPALAADEVAAALRRQGLVLTAARCPLDPGRPDPWRGWYHLVAGKVSGNLYIGRLSSGRQGYTLFLGDLPTMTQEEASRFVDCAGGQPAGGRSAAAPATGQAGIAAVIEALLRPAGSPAWLPWRAPLPAISWNSLGPQKFPRGEWSAGGADANPQQISGDFRTPTTVMTVSATGGARGASRFYLENGGHLPRDAVFGILRRDGYAIAAVTCGKPYTQMSENWFRITKPGVQPAILYRSMSISTGEPTETYAVRLDNVAPPVLPGQRAAAGGTCPG